MPARPSARLLSILALVVGCAVGDTSNGFSSGSLTFGGGPGGGDGPGGSGESGESGASEGGGEGSATSGASGNDSTGGGGGCAPNEAGQPCETGMPGVCAPGTTACEAGVVVCQPDVAPSAELCDGLDNDCNGEADDGNPEAGGACNTGMPGVCADGTGSCAAGVVECIPNVAASAEACDGLDNDCNGQVDDGNPGGGAACGTGQPGICSAGTQQCSGGALACQPTQMPAPTDTCYNSLDDDCDGAVDDGCCAHDICVTGVALVAGCDPCVATVCGFDSFCCTNSWDLYCVQEVTDYCGIPC